MSRNRTPKSSPPWWPCEQTGKRGFATKLDAITVLASSSRKKAMSRAYECPSCKRWHLTKMAKVNP